MIMSDLPKQVEEAADLAEELHGRMFAPQEEDKQEEVQEEQQEEEAPAVEDNTDDDSFKTKYEVLKGKYDAEVPRLHHDLKELKQMVFEKLQAQTQPKPEEKPSPYQEQLEKYKEEYGEELLEMNRLLARMEAEALFAERAQPLQQQVQDVEETQIKAAQQNFVEYLGQKVKGDWQTLWSGQDKGFIDFLQKPDPSGLYTYGDLVKAYNDNWDADKLATVFNTYLDAKAPKQEQQRQPNPAKQAIVAPSRSTQAPAPQSSDKTVWTRETMAEFQKNDRMGKYDEATSKAMWEDLLSAPSENRIR